MVFFTCNACGESLKKAQVDKHVMKCRGCEVLSCIDCGKDFWGDDYKDHNKCISENQKYGGKGYEAKTNKGDVKQQQWMQKIHEAMDKPGVTPKLRDILKQVSSYDNVPRKKAKFQNWMQNSLKIFNPSLQDQVWEVFSAATSQDQEKPSNQQQPLNSTNGTAKAEENGTAQPEPSNEVAAPPKEKKKNKRERKEDRQLKKKPKKGHGNVNGQDEGEQHAEEASEKQKKKKKKRKMEEVEEEDDETPNGQTVETESKPKKSKKDHLDDTQNSEVADDEQGEADEPHTKGKFNWKGTIKAVLRQSPEEGIAVKKLRKKVLGAYYSFSGNGNFKSEEEVFSLFNKKLNCNPKFKVLKDKVRLVK
ncbi:cell growth-regulating nucleolar protein [Clupea harengus]|uniref:Cell growth-regulating nucleolar protein n=1 Tax=Clupea harengus TaxID=7950 RepID=A0A6P3WDE5_CLUHA|nr:cell growth-regulating nucleolar protein [Clupea harengus]